MIKSEVGERWDELGTELGLSEDELGTIRCKHPKNATQYMLKKWLKREDHSWRVLVDALSRVNPETANRVEQCLNMKNTDDIV